jgi:mannosyltransferase
MRRSPVQAVHTPVSAPPRARVQRRDGIRWALAAAALLAFAVRAWHLAGQCLWSDEDITLDRARQTLGSLIGGLPIEHAPLYFVTMRLWTRLAGDGDLALRLPSLLAGVATVALVGYVAARLVDWRCGIVAALVVAVNPFQVWYAQEARMYTLVGALALGSVAAVLRAEATGRRRWWVVAGLLAALTVLTHYYGALVVFVLVAWAVVDLVRRGRGALTGWGIAGLTAAVLFLPWLPHALRVLDFPGWRAPEPLARVPWINLSAWSAGPTATPLEARWITVLYVALALVGVVVLARRAAGGRPSPRTPVIIHPSPFLLPLRVLLYALVPVVIGALLMLRKADFHPRYFFAVLPAFVILVAAGATALPQRARRLATAALVIAAVPPLANLYVDPAFQKQDYRAVIATIEGTTAATDSVLLLDGPAFGMFERYRSADDPLRLVNLHSQALDRVEPVKLDAEIAQRVAGFRHLWRASDGAGTGAGRDWLVRHTFPVEERRIQQVTLARFYQVAGQPAGDAFTGRDLGGPPFTPARLAADVPGDVRAGDVLPVTLRWGVRYPPREGHPLIDELRVSVRLVDASGSVAAAVDRRPADWTRPTSTWGAGESIVDRHGLLVPAGTVPGTYGLDIVLYDETTLAALGTWRWSGPVIVRTIP